MKFNTVCATLMVLISLLSCQQNNKNSEKDELIVKSDSTSKHNISSKIIDTIKPSVNNVKVCPESQNVSCEKLIVSLVKKSSFDADMKKLITGARIDKINNDIITIEMLSTNEERHDDVPLGWIELDRNKKKLRDITVDPGDPINLQYDTSLFNLVESHCRGDE